jgi:catecholate siderophore receptor
MANHRQSLRSSLESVQRPLSLRSAHVPRPAAALALGVSMALTAGAVNAQTDEDTLELDTLRIEDETLDTNPYAEKGAPYKAKVSGDLRRTEELADTAATISVLTQAQIKDSGLSDLRDIVSAQPGITVGTGENGNAFGDRYVIRGQEARSDVFIDGLRDPGMTIRESFAVEQIEITKGPSSTFAGRGSSGGTINSITKRASTDYQFNELELGLGTDGFHRVSLDSNLPLGERAALRANLLNADEEVPDRAPAERSRDGAALSALFAPTDSFEILADFYGLNADGAADLGTYITPGGGLPVADLPAYLQDQDFVESEARIGTLRLGLQANDGLRFENALRYGETENGYVLTGARGSSRGANDTEAPGAPTVTLSTHQGWQEVEYVVDQFNALWNPVFAGREHNFVFGVEYSDLEVRNGVFAVTNGGAPNCRTGSATANNAFCMLDGQGNVVPGLHNLLGRQIVRGDFDSDYAVETAALYAIDSFDVSDRLNLSIGLRLDDFDYSNTVRGRDGSLTPYTYSDSLWNGNLGLTWRLSDHANLYFAYASAADINGGESDVGGSCGYGGLCGTPEQVVLSEPERVQNLELGAKVELFDDKLLATAAVFQITKDDVMESVGDNYSSLGTLNTGKNRVRGIEFGLSGNLTDKLSTQFSATFMESEVLEAFVENQIGKVLSNFADDQAFLQLRYQATPKFAFGGAVTYTSEMYAGQPDTAAGFSSATGEYSYRVPGYTTWDAFASYAFTDTVELRLNVDNVFDKDYYLAAYRSGAFTYIGDARNAQLTLGVQF